MLNIYFIIFFQKTLPVRTQQEKQKYHLVSGSMKQQLLPFRLFDYLWWESNPEPQA
jgi:hypothetical protein